MIPHILQPHRVLHGLNIRPGFIVGDLGSGGSGTFTLPISRMVGAGGRVYAIDILTKALSALRGKIRLFNLSNIIPVRADIESCESIGLDSDSLDLALLVNVLHQARNPAAMLATALRLLKTGGTLLVINFTAQGAMLWGLGERHIGQDHCRALLDDHEIMSCTPMRLGDIYYAFIIKK